MEKVNPITIKGVKELGEKKLVGFRVVCEDMEGYGQEIPKASMLLARRKDEIKHLVEPVKLIGAFKVAGTSKDDDGYWVCHEVYDFEDIPEGMVSLIVPAQKYGILHFNGHASEIYHVHTHLHQWIDENGHKRLLEKWSLEIYSKWTETEDSVDLCDPIL
ncbi:GyrI-like domain-containing protein [Bacillus spongiae]|uniref:GyrI-like domain-containing protein n=1 Tax=Bacillus spongiae TaxID=2683610 RepID=A0ABU8H8G7_9BACI